MASELFIVGTQGLAKELAQLVRCLDPWARAWPRIHYVTHDAAQLGAARPFGVIDTLDDALRERTEPADVVIGIGYPALRRRMVKALAGNPVLRYPNLVHPQVHVDPDLVRLGVGNMITQGVVMTCDIVLGDFNLLNWNVTVGHDCRLGSFNVINPAASVSGNVTLGDGCLVGTGARILERLSVADDSTLGAGAVLTRSITMPSGTHVGVPARRVSP